MVHGDGGILLQTREEPIIKPPAGDFISTLTRGPFSESRENNFFLVSHKWSQKGPYFFLVSHISFSFRIVFRLSCLLSLITSILPSVGLFKKAHENCCPPYTTRARLTTSPQRSREHCTPSYCSDTLKQQSSRHPYTRPHHYSSYHVQASREGPADAEVHVNFL